VAAALALVRSSDSASALSWVQLRNATYPSEFPRSKAAPLKDGVYEEEIVPGAATRLKIQLADIADFGRIDDNSSIDAAVILIGPPGGSGTFIHLVAVLNDSGAPTPVASALLGDRVAVRGIRIEEQKIIVRMRVRGPSDPLAVLTTEVTRVYSLRDGQLALESERTAEVPSTPPDQFAFQTQQLAIETGKPVTQKGVLRPGELATYLINADSGRELRVSASSQFNNAILSIQGVSDLSQLVSRSSYLSSWSGRLPASQTYAITVITLAGNDINYELKVELRASPASSPTATARPPATPTRVPGGPGGSVPAPIKGSFRPVQLQLSAVSNGASTFLSGRAPTWGIAAALPATGVLYAENGDSQFELASVVKVLIALAVMDAAQRESRFVDSFELALLWPMITLSDNDSASRLWDQIQGGPGLANYVARIGETGVRPYDGEFWGTSTASPSSLARILARAAFGDLLNTDHRALFLKLLEQVTPSQRWGVTAGLEGEGGRVALVGIKNGWYQADAGWRVNSIAYVVRSDGQRFYTLVVLTNAQPSWAYGVSTIENAAEQVNAALLEITPVSNRP
jgi:hypothetical protein